MAIFIFLVIIVAGLCAFGLVFVKEFNSGALNDSSAALPATPGLPRKLLSGGALAEGPVEPSMSPETAPGGILGERYKKLEQLLEEKSRSLEQAERDLANERSHRGEFESIKDILQRQIEDLKAQNRRVKEDLAKALQENIGRQSASAAVEHPVAEAPVVSDAPGEQFEQFFNKNETTAPALSLHDIFENKQKPI